MSIQTKTLEIYPVYHSNQRTEFRLDGNVYLLNTLRLSNVRPTVVSNGELQYQNGTGSFIRHITLYSGNLPIDSCRDAKKWLSFEEMRGINPQNSDISNQLTHTRLGFKVGSDTTNGVPSIKFVNSSTVYTSLSGVDLEGTLVLQRCLKFLSALPVVNAKNLDLRLVIEWETTASEIFVSGAVPTSFSMEEPVLFADQVVSGVDAKPNFSVRYNSLEQDRVAIVDVGNGAKQRVNLMVNGFNGKQLGRLLFINNPSTHFHRVIDGSVAQKEEKINFRVNNQTLFVGDGINDANKKLDLLVNTYGEMNVCQGTQFWSLENASNHLEGEDPRYLGGVVSYGAVSIQRRINSLELDYSRTGTTTISGNNGIDPFTMLLYGEVSKTLVVNGNSVVVSYA